MKKRYSSHLLNQMFHRSITYTITWLVQQGRLLDLAIIHDCSTEGAAIKTVRNILRTLSVASNAEGKSLVVVLTERKAILKMMLTLARHAWR